MLSVKFRSFITTYTTTLYLSIDLAIHTQGFPKS